MIIHSLIQRIKSDNGGKLSSKVGNNGYGKSELKIDMTAVDKDFKELRSQLAVKFVDKLTKRLKIENGTRLDVQCHLEVIRFSLRQLELIISQSPELKYILLN